MRLSTGVSSGMVPEKPVICKRMGWSRTMGRWLTTLFVGVMCLNTVVVAADYVVAPGQPGGNGSRERPFNSLQAALARAGAKDTVHVLRGGIYREPAGLSFRNGVTVVAAGPSNVPAPIITTSIEVPKFTPWDDNKKVLTASVEKPVLALYVNGSFVRLARYPNSGYMRSTKASTPDVLVDPQRAKQPQAKKGKWDGAQIRWRRWSWWWETRPITSDDGESRIKLGADGKFQDGFVGDSSAWFVDNCLAELDAPGEWFWDAATKMLYVYPPSDAGEKPIVEIVTDSDGYSAGGKATVDGLHFARIAGKTMTLGSTATIKNCIFSDLTTNGINGSWEAYGSQIVGNTFRDIHNNAIEWLENPGASGGTIIANNTMERIGMEFGYGGSGSWKGCGIILHKANKVVVRENRITDTGYAGIIVGSDGHTVERNVFVRCMGSLNDGAGIYVCANHTTIRDNIVLDTVGNLDTSQFWYPLGHGIWCEFLSDFHDQTITGNTVVGCGGHGLFLTNNYNCVVDDNVFAGNRLGALHVSGNKGEQKHKITNNILIAETPSRRTVYPEQIPDNWAGNDHVRCIDSKDQINYGSMTNTMLIASPGVPLLTYAGKKYETTENWSGLASWLDAGAHVQRASALVLINDTNESYAMPIPNGKWQLANGDSSERTITIAPFHSAVIVSARDGNGLPPYVLASTLSTQDTLAEKAKVPKNPTKTPKNKANAAKTATTTSVAPAKTVEPAILQEWDRHLQKAIQAAIAAKRMPAFNSQTFRAQILISEIDDNGDMLALMNGGRISLSWRQLDVNERAEIARDIASTAPLSQAITAFYLFAANRQSDAHDYLIKAGDAGNAVRDIFSIQ